MERRSPNQTTPASATSLDGLRALRYGAWPMAIDPRLLALLACPEDKGPLLYFPVEGVLYNPRLRRRYRVEDDVPQMLLDEATTATEAEHVALLEKAAAEGVRPNF